MRWPPNDKHFSGGLSATQRSMFRFSLTGASGAGHCGPQVARPLQARV